MTNRWFWPAVAAVGGLGVFAGLAVAVRAVLMSGGDSAAKAPEFGLWSALVAASVVVFGYLFAATVRHAMGWRRLVGVPGWLPVACYAVFAAALFFFLSQATNSVASLRPDTVLPVSRGLLVIGLVSTAPAVLGLWLVHARLRQISALFDERVEQAREAGDVLADLIECRRVQSTCLTVLAIIVTVAVVDAGAQRKAFLATGTRPEVFPPEAVLLYGGLFTAVALLLYVPTFIAWRSRCQRFVDLIYPLPADARPGEEWVAGRSRLTQAMGADTSVARSLTAAFGILAPLATSVLSVVVPGLK